MTASNRLAFITGGSRGIGRSTALRLAQEGFDVAFTYFNSPERAHQVERELVDLGVRALALRADAARPQEVKEALAEAVRRFGRLDVLVNNAGIYPMGTTADVSDEDYDRALATNVTALHAAMQAADPHLQSGGRVINIGSVFGQRVPFAGITLYGMHKAAVASLTRGWSREYGPRGVTVNCLQLGPINTEMNPSDADHAPMLTGMTSLGRYGEPEEVAATIAFLAGAESSYINGAVLNVDGGMEA